MKSGFGIILVAVIVVAIVIGAWALIAIQGKERLVISTTTSLYETGLLKILGSKFEKKHSNVNVAFISQGTGLAIQTAMRGNADMILVHDRAREETFLDDGYGVNRKIIAYNYFAVVGPEEDPAGVEGLDPVNALLQIKSSGEEGDALWVSRGDDSGTHAREKKLWIIGGENATELRDLPWYFEAGSSMTATLNLADEKRAYTLCDMGSYLNNYVLGNIDLKIVVEAGKDTLNVYSAIACDPRKDGLSHVRFSYAMNFIEFLVSDEIQEILNEFGVDKFGQPLFYPAVEILETGTDPKTASWIRELAFIEGAECPPEKRYEAGNLTFLDIVLTLLPVKRENLP
ncbi:tungsten ABC transporter permease [Candidatus Bathyarchaeota archaeon]|nr:tungsten ABC transporter permease [Candidatus Bathyarchaeota archaeon]